MYNKSAKDGCKFCRDNGLLEDEVVGTSAGAYALEASTRFGHYLIIPEDHCEALEELSDDWWQNVKILLAKLHLANDYNLSINIGEQAGQRLKHLHFWIIPRQPGKPSSAKGLAALIAEVDGEA